MRNFVFVLILIFLPPVSDVSRFCFARKANLCKMMSSPRPGLEEASNENEKNANANACAGEGAYWKHYDIAEGPGDINRNRRPIKKVRLDSTGRSVNAGSCKEAYG